MTDELKIKYEQFNRILDLLEHSDSGVWYSDENFNLHFYNKKFYEQFPINPEKCSYDDFLSIIHPEDQEIFNTNVQIHSKGPVEYSSVYRLINKEGEVVWIDAFGIANHDEDGNIIDMVGFHKDVSKRKKIEDHIYEIAFREELTGLYNRVKLISDVEDKIQRDAFFSILRFRLKDYSKLLASYGFTRLNEIIRSIAEVAKKVLQDDMTLYHISTSDFVVLAENVYSLEVARKYIRIFDIWLKRISKRLELDIPLRIYSSYLLYPIDEDIDAERIVYMLNLMLDEACRVDNNELMIYEYDTQARLVYQLYIEQNLLNAVKNEEFYLLYQPVIDLSMHTVSGFEALVRWNSKEYGLIFPDEFIPIAENNRAIIPLGEFIIYKALSFIKEYNKKKQKNYYVSINISALQLLQDDFITKVEKLIQFVDVNPKFIKFELTESTLINDPEKAVRQMIKVRSLGIRLSLDDFGTGYASMNHLFNLPLDEVKLDRSLMLTAVTDKSILEFLYSLAQLCHKNEVKVVAEGIEDLKMINNCKRMTIDYLQGYFFSKPLTEDEVYQLVIEDMFRK